MKLLSKNDALYATITGLTTGILSWQILRYLGKPSMPWLVLVIPILWLLGVQLGYFLGRWMGFFDQFGKFAAIGFTNFAVDAGILNLLIFFTKTFEGTEYTIFKIVSFTIAVCHSYFWNSVWTFQSQERSGTEFAKFIAVMIASLVVNVGTASLIVNFVPSGSTSPEVWANIGAVIGSATALIFSFIGFKLVVFKK